MNKVDYTSVCRQDRLLKYNIQIKRFGVLRHPDQLWKHYISELAHGIDPAGCTDVISGGVLRMHKQFLRELSFSLICTSLAKACLKFKNKIFFGNFLSHKAVPNKTSTLKLMRACYSKGF